MELLLNLVWLLLALPAFWLWRRGAHEGEQSRFGSLHCVLALGCLLILLFPVISATDDLHAMRAEMEEPGTNKRTVRQSAGDKSAVDGRSHFAPVLLAGIFSSIPGCEYWLDTQKVAAKSAEGTLVIRASRAPPVSRLA